MQQKKANINNKHTKKNLKNTINFIVLKLKI